MKKVFFIFAAIVMVAGFSSKVMAQGAVGSASALVSAGLEITSTAALNFGAFVPSASVATTVIVDATDGSRTGTATRLGTASAAGAFSVQGSVGNVVTVNVPASITITGPGDPMVITTTKTPVGGTLAMADGTGIIKVGGSLAVAAGQTVGSYTGTYNVTVNY